jgi:glutathione S-transferase
VPYFHNERQGWRARRAERATLYTRPECPYSPIVAAMLDHKQLRYRRFDLIPGPHVPVLRALRFPDATVPALRLAGQRIQATIDAAYAMDRLRRERPLLPADRDHRQLVEDITGWARETIGPVKNDLYWWGMHLDPAAAVVLWENHRTGVPKPIIRRAIPRSVRAMGRSEPPDPKAGLRRLATVPGLLQRIDASVAAGVIGGEELNVGDFHAAMLARLLMSLADLEPIVRDTPAGKLAARIYTGPLARAAPFLTDEQLQIVHSPADRQAV